jgi:hypothetical protein
MKNILQYSVAGVVEKFRNTKENYDGEDPDKKQQDKMSPVFALLILGIILFLTLGIWIWALVVLVKYWQVLPDWAKIVGIIGILPIIPFGPIITLLCVYIGKNSGNSPLSASSQMSQGSAPASSQMSQGSAPVSSQGSQGSSSEIRSNSSPPEYSAMSNSASSSKNSLD